MEFIKLEVFGVDGGAPIMAKEHSALQELFKLNAGEQLCLALLKDFQRFHFYMQTSSLMGCCSKRPPPRRRVRSLFWDY